MKILDCFTFLDEPDLLELRFLELNDVVDYFIIAEANKTFSGRDKDFNLEHYGDITKPYEDKIIYIKITDMPPVRNGNAWPCEYHSRQCLIRGLDKVATPGDLVLLSDVDEIPRAEAVTNVGTNAIFGFDMRFIRFYLNIECTTGWRGTTSIPYSKQINLQQVRHAKDRYPAVVDGGWHISSTGEKEKLKTKIRSFSHTEVAHFAEDDNAIEQLMTVYKLHPSHHADEHKMIEIDDNFPKHIEQIYKKYPYLIHPDYREKYL